MGISISASAQNSGCEVYWVSEGRRQTTHERAAQVGLRDARTLAALCAECAIIISVCPPHAAILCCAGMLGVREELFQQWKHDDPALPEQVQKRVQANTSKAWRFVGEMEEISRTFREAGVPGEFHAAAANIYQRLARFKDSRTPPTLEEILSALTEGVATHETR